MSISIFLCFSIHTNIYSPVYSTISSPSTSRSHKQQFCSENLDVLNAFANEVVHSANGTIIHTEAMLGVRKSAFAIRFYSSNETCIKGGSLYAGYSPREVPLESVYV